MKMVLSSMLIANGLYILVMQLARSRSIAAGKLSETVFPRGRYIYIGRAKNGLKNRISRHLRQEKKLFWHIDYFISFSWVEEVWVRSGHFDECGHLSRIKAALPDHSIPGKRFGASDCRCPSHLIHIPNDTSSLVNILKQLGFRKVGRHGNNSKTNRDHPFTVQNKRRHLDTEKCGSSRF